MTRLQPIAALCALGLFAMPAFAATADDAATLRAELAILKADYAARVDALEARIGQLEAAAAGPQPPPEPPAPPPPPQPGARGSATAFNPALAVSSRRSFRTLTTSSSFLRFLLRISSMRRAK